jgi:hypothetical protein
MGELAKDRMRFVRLSAFEDQLLQAVMAYEHINVSDALRLGLREAAKHRGLWPVDGECPPTTDQEAA